MSVLKGKDLKDIWATFTLSGSEPAFHIIYSHYYHYLNFIGSKRNFDEGKIKDGINDVFLYLWENNTNLQNISNHHNYIITSFLRKLYRKNSLIVEEIPELEEVADTLISPSVEDLFMQQHIDETVSRLIKDKVDQLANKQQHLIYQKFYLGLSYQEISDANNISINTVYNTIYKATSKLKSLITKEQGTFLTLAVSMASIIIFIFFQIQ